MVAWWLRERLTEWPERPALIWRDRMGSLTKMATHDTALGLAARAFGFEVLGI